MASVSNLSPATPKQASRRRAALDRRLDTALFKALADPTRARLLACLVKCGRRCSVSELAECCAVDFSVVARHLHTLARARAVQCRREGRVAWYRARCPALSARLRALADAIDEWCPTTCCSTVDRGQPARPDTCCPIERTSEPPPASGDALRDESAGPDCPCAGDDPARV